MLPCSAGFVLVGWENVSRTPRTTAGARSARWDLGPSGSLGKAQMWDVGSRDLEPEV